MSQKMLTTAAVIIAVLALVVASPGAEQAERDTISVSGNAEVEANPDKAEVLIRVETRDKDVNIAQEDNRKKSDKVMKALNEYGIPESNIQTTDYRIHRRRPEPKFRDATGEQSTEEVFQVVNVIKVETPDTQNVGEIVDTAVEAGANGIDRISFTLTKEKERVIQDRALKKAAGVANQKASSLAASMGVRVKRPVKISESSFDVVRFDARETAMAQDGGSGAPSTQIEPEDVKVTARITAEYLIR